MSLSDLEASLARWRRDLFVKINSFLAHGGKGLDSRAWQKALRRSLCQVHTRSHSLRNSGDAEEIQDRVLGMF